MRKLSVKAVLEGEIELPKATILVGNIPWPTNWGNKPEMTNGLDYHTIELTDYNERVPITMEVIDKFHETHRKANPIVRALPNPVIEKNNFKLLLKVAYLVKKNLI